MQNTDGRSVCRTNTRWISEAEREQFLRFYRHFHRSQDNLTAIEKYLIPQLFSFDASPLITMEILALITLETYFKEDSLNLYVPYLDISQKRL